MSARIESIVYKPQHVSFEPPSRFSRVSLEQARLIKDHGIEGDTKGGRTRQLNIMSRETLDRLQEQGLNTAPGEMGEQIVLSGVDVDALQKGDVIQLGGQAEVRVEMPRRGCSRFKTIQGVNPSSVNGSLGVIASVLTEGPIRRGDPVQVRKAEGDHVGVRDR